MIKLCAFADEASPNVTGQIAAMKRNGISLLEIRGVDGTNISEISADKAREVRRMLDAEGMAVWSMGSPIGKISLGADFAPHVEAFKRILEYSDILGASKIRLFSFYPVAGESEEVTLEKVLERLNVFCDLTPDHITLCHENEKKIYGETAEKCLNIHKALPKVRAVFDPANYVQCGVPVAQALDRLFEQTDYFHIKDVIAETGELVPAGYGDGAIEAIVSRIRTSGRDAVLTVEPHLQSFVGYTEIDTEEMKHRFHFASTRESFAAAVHALKGILSAQGLRETALDQTRKGWYTV